MGFRAVRSEFWDAAIEAEVIRWEVESRSALVDSNRMVKDVWIVTRWGMRERWGGRPRFYL